MTTQESIKEAAKDLDNKIPNWSDKINISILKMSSPECCVLGQLSRHKDAESYEYIIDKYDLNPYPFLGTPRDGFVKPEDYDSYNVFGDASLNEHWISEVRSRRRKLVPA